MGAKARSLFKPKSSNSKKENETLSLEERISNSLIQSDDNKKIFVLDTNIIIDDFSAPYNFGNNPKIIAFSTIERELNNVAKKTKKASTRYGASEAKKMLHNLIEEGVEQGVNFSYQPVRLDKGDFDMVYLIGDTSLRKQKLEIDCDLGQGDLNILNTAKFFDKIGKEKGYETVLVTNDISLSTLAKVNGIKAESLKRGSVNLDEISKGYFFCKNDNALVELMKYADKKHRNIPFEHFNNVIAENFRIPDLPHNSYVVFVGSDEDVFKKVNSNGGEFRENLTSLPYMIYRVNRKEGILSEPRYNVPYKSIGGLTPRNLEQYLFMNDCIDDNIKLVIGHGVEGTGKTILALGAAMYLAGKHVREGHQSKKKSIESTDDVKENYKLDTQRSLESLIKLSKPLVHSEDVGYLPGGMDEKLAHDYYSFRSAIKKLWNMIEKNNVPDFGYSNKYSIISKYDSFDDAINGKNPLFMNAPMGYVRGVDWGSGIWIIDEFQNKSPREARPLITRAEDSVKIIICGCPNQVDNKFLRDNYNALAFVLDHIQKTNTSKEKYMKAPFVNSIQLSKAERGKLSEWGASLDAEEYKNK
jgi:PhoH-like ATPase